jgi:hypothetical protein
MTTTKRNFDDYVTSQVDAPDSSPQRPILAPSPSPDIEDDDITGADAVAGDDEGAQPSTVSALAAADVSVGGEQAGGEGKKPTARLKEERAPGSTLLPLSRVQKIMRADKEMGAAGKEAVFLIAVATVRSTSIVIHIIITEIAYFFRRNLSRGWPSLAIP